MEGGIFVILLLRVRSYPRPDGTKTEENVMGVCLTGVRGGKPGQSAVKIRSWNIHWRFVAIVRLQLSAMVHLCRRFFHLRLSLSYCLPPFRLFGSFSYNFFFFIFVRLLLLPLARNRRRGTERQSDMDIGHSWPYLE